MTNLTDTKKNNSIKIAIAGITGKMGKSINECLLENTELQLTCATLSSNNEMLGKTIVECGLGDSEIVTSHNLHDNFDVLIDFTNIENTLNNLKFCAENNKAIVIGTTGFNDYELEKIAEFAQKTSILISANMSLGVNVMRYLCEIATKALHNKSDIEIVETHHKNKIDAPSGTAIMLGKAIAASANLNLSESGVFSRHGIIGKREENTIGFSTIRGGDVIGEHTVHYFLADERLEITHKATDRKVFARGALFAAKYLANQHNKTKFGLYNMNDAIEFSG